MTIRFFLLQNRQGKTRLSKWYVAVEESDKRKIESEVHRLVTTRDNKFTNFVEVRCGKLGTALAALFQPCCVLRAHAALGGLLTCSPLFPSLPHPLSALQYRSTYKVIYRRYAGLFFSLCVDVSDNELSYVEAIHCFVEMLDRYFGNVCELDLVFNFHKAYTILDEFILAGELQETSQLVMLDRLKELEKMMM